MIAIFEELKEFTQKNKDAVPKIITIPVERKNRFQYVGGQIADDKLYAVPNSAETMLRYDIKTGKADFFGRFNDTDFKWSGGCMYKDVFYGQLLNCENPEV